MTHTYPDDAPDTRSWWGVANRCRPVAQPPAGVAIEQVALFRGATLKEAARGACERDTGSWLPAHMPVIARPVQGKDRYYGGVNRRVYIVYHYSLPCWPAVSLAAVWVRLKIVEPGARSLRLRSHGSTRVLRRGERTKHTRFQPRPQSASAAMRPQSQASPTHSTILRRTLAWPGKDHDRKRTLKGLCGALRSRFPPPVAGQADPSGSVPCHGPCRARPTTPARVRPCA